MDEPKVDLYTSPDLCECHLIGNDEERRFLGRVFRSTSVPKAEFLLSQQPMDDLTCDIEVMGSKLCSWLMVLAYAMVILRWS